MGVAPAGFEYPAGTDAWIPLPTDFTAQVDIGERRLRHHHGRRRAREEGTAAEVGARGVQLRAVHRHARGRDHYGKPALRDLVPLQDDINRSRSHKAERMAILSRLIFTAPKGHGLNVRTLGGMPGMLLETRGAEYKPEVLQLAANDGGSSSEFYNESLAAAADVGDMNEASTGKLPSAGLAAKAIYALHHADERNVSEVSTEQDEAQAHRQGARRDHAHRVHRGAKDSHRRR